MSLSVNLPFPPSTNRIWRNVVIKGQTRTLLSTDGRRYRAEVERAVKHSEVVGVGGSQARAVLAAWVPDARRRDLDNLLKATLDAAVHAGLLLDDSQITDLRIYRAGIDRKNPRIILWLEPVEVAA